MKFKILALTLFVAFAFAVVPSQAQSTLIPDGLNYQGFLTDLNGDPIGQGSAVTTTIDFRIYETAEGGNPVWGEQQLVSVFNGNFSVILGNGIALDAGLASGLPALTSLLSTPPSSDLFFGITQSGQSEFTPRQQVLSTAFSFRSKVAENALLADKALVADSLSAGGTGGTSEIVRITPQGLELGAETTDSVSISAAANGVLEIRDTDETEPLLSVSTTGLNTGAISATGNISTTGSVSAAGGFSGGSISGAFATFTQRVTGLDVLSQTNIWSSADVIGNTLLAYDSPFTRAGNRSYRNPYDLEFIREFGNNISRSTRIRPNNDFGGSATGTWIDFVFSNTYTVRLNAAGNLFTTSDRRMKHNIHELEFSKSAFAELRPVHFNYIGSTPESPQVNGFIAQELQEIYPDMVQDMGNDQLGINMDQMIPINTAAIQAQQKEIDALQQALDAALQREAQFEARLAALERLLEE